MLCWLRSRWRLAASTVGAASERAAALRLVAGLALIAINLGLLNYLGARHYVRADWTGARVYALAETTRRVLTGLRQPVRITVLMAPAAPAADAVDGELRELLRQLARWSTRLQTRFIDVDADPAAATLRAKALGVPRSELREGVVVVSSGGRSRYVPARALAERRSEGGRHVISAFRGESELLAALLAVTQPRAVTVCFTTGHGEASSDSYAPAGYGELADELRRDALRPRELSGTELLGGARGCNVVLIGGPTRLLAARELAALDRFLTGGGRLLVLIGPLLDRGVTRYRGCGIEPWLQTWGVALPRNVVVDPQALPGEQPLLTWGTRDGYSDHPLARVMAGRLTVWPLAREVRPAPEAATTRPGLQVAPLVQSSARGWGEGDLAALRGDRALRFDAGLDGVGPVTVAAAVRWRRARIVVLGSERGVLNDRLGADASRDDNRDLLLSALHWLVEESQRLGIGARTVERTRLIADAGQLRRVWALTVVALPGLALAAALIAWWRRRR
ncbi:MAG: GldG family protein [Proteobacteria bacterium]|nr:GldG family protein [Pseudomonadota bacterium]